MNEETNSTEISKEDRFTEKCLELLSCSQELEAARAELSNQIKITNNYRIALMRTIESISN